MKLLQKKSERVIQLLACASAVNEPCMGIEQKVVAHGTHKAPFLLIEKKSFQKFVSKKNNRIPGRYKTVNSC